MKSQNKKYCLWCGGVTKNPPSSASKIPLIEMFEQDIDKMGRDRVYSDYFSDNIIEGSPDDRVKIYTYLDLLNDVLERTICDSCLKNDDELFNKYYSGGNDELWDGDFGEELSVD